MKLATGLMKKSMNGLKQEVRVILMDPAFDGYDMKVALYLNKPGMESMSTFTRHPECYAHE